MHRSYVAVNICAAVHHGCMNFIVLCFNANKSSLKLSIELHQKRAAVLSEFYLNLE